MAGEEGIVHFCRLCFVRQIKTLLFCRPWNIFQPELHFALQPAN